MFLTGEGLVLAALLVAIVLGAIAVAAIVRRWTAEAPPRAARSWHPQPSVPLPRVTLPPGRMHRI